MSELHIGGLAGACVVRPGAFHGEVEVVQADLCRRRYPARVAVGFELCATRNVEPTHNIVNGKSFDVRSGTLLVVEPGTVWQAEGQDSFRSLELTPGRLAGWWASRARFAPSYFDPALASWFEREHEALCVECDPLAAGERMELILNHVLTTCVGSLRPAERASRAELERVRALLYEDFAARRSLDDVVHTAAVRVGKFQLLRSFRKRFGVTPHQYLRLVRLARAQSFLREGKSVAQTALDVGFFDQAHFSHAFVAVYGVTPGRFATRQRFTSRA